ncbi:hypothetical protein DSO57_1000069 [Entomophthora muscae]|nr:hypothetical protein DSO57_1000069 [Entomophthora muscae]
MAQVKVSYLQRESSQIENALQHAFTSNKDVASVSCKDHDSLEKSLTTGEVSHAILAVENSISGSFTHSLDFLVSRPSLYIVGEVVLEENISLLAHENTPIEKIKEIVALPHTMEQTRGQIFEILAREIPFKIVPDFSLVAKKIGSGELPGTAILANNSAVTSYKLKVLKGNLGAHAEHNFTRYLLISKNPAAPEKHQLPKTTVAITLKNVPGSLSKVFSVFSLRDLNVCKVESRATIRSVRGGSAWEYTMVVDVDGAPQIDTKLNAALENLKEFSTNVHVLGSYPR